MGEWLVWLVLGALILVVFCIYSLSSQLERCVQLAVEIITGNQRKILAQLEALAASRRAAMYPDNVVPFERRKTQRRRQAPSEGIRVSDERRRSHGRRIDDLATPQPSN